MTEVEIKFADIIKLILQFFQQNKLQQSFHTLQKQTNININCVDSIKLLNSIKQSKWDQTLCFLKYMMPSQSNLFSLYELMVDDLLQSNHYEAASYIIKQLIRKKITNIQYEESILRMQYICENPSKKNLYKKIITQNRKMQVTNRLISDLNSNVSDGRLLHLLGQAIKYQAILGQLHPNIKLNIFQGRQPNIQSEMQEVINHMDKLVQYDSDCKICSMSLSHSGYLLGLGGSDGLIQIYNTEDNTLNQIQGNQITAMYHQQPVILLQFNHSDDILATADPKANIKLWNVETGKLLRKFGTNQQTLTILFWGCEVSHLLAGCCSVSLYGIRSCNKLKQYNVSHNNQYLLSAHLLQEQYRIITCTSTGILKLFNYITQEQLKQISLNSNLLMSIKYRSNIIIALSERIIVLDYHFLEVSNQFSKNTEFFSFVCKDLYQYYCCKKLSEQKFYIQVVSRKNNTVIYNKVIDSKINLLLLHPHRNSLITYNQNDQLMFWVHVS